MTPLEQLRRDGAALLPQHVPAEALAGIVSHLRLCGAYNAHVQAYATSAPVQTEEVIRSGQWPMFSNSMRDVVRARGVLPIALSVRELAEAYFGEPALLYSVNAHWTQPARAPVYGQTHGWHRDGDDRKFLALFVYGADVLSREDGSHRYLAGSHLDPEAPVPPKVDREATEILGEAGTMFIEDGRVLHKGERPRRGLRLMLWARWGVSDPPRSYAWDRLSPVHPGELLEPSDYPEEEDMRQAIRLVVRR